jgi:hypothetical protein
MKTKSVLSLVVGILLIALAMPAAWSAEAASPPRHTVVVYEASGGSITAVESLIVYLDGLSVLAREKGTSDKVCRATASAAQVQTLQKALLTGRALTLTNGFGNPDVQTKIVTFFKPRRSAGQTPSNTFSYIAVEGAYAKVQAAIDAFISAVFPSC